MTGPALTYELVAAELRPLGVKIAAIPGDYILTYRGHRDSPELRFADLADALALGREMAGRRPESFPATMGPTGRRRSRRGLMLKHNRWVAARRRAVAAKAAGKGARP
ncbi:MAG: hypothetical protein B7W99_00850 [Rhodospirillales bacterium 20-58-10]|nr:MAG: hypothetical protein B7W99_00850 [Rhodospirillales bacterium 20-58-10]